MKRYCFLPVMTCLTICTAQTQAMPVAPIALQSVSILVASGCGLGVRRGPFDGCETVYDGNYAGVGRSPYNHYYAGFSRDGICSRRNMHIVCNSFGLCHMVCN